MFLTVLLVCCLLVIPHVKAGDETPEAPNFTGPSVYQITKPVDHSEEPTWDARKNILYYVDIHSGRVMSYNYNTSKVNSITLNGEVTPVIPSKSDENLMIVGLNRSLVGIEWDGQKELGSQRVLTTVSNQFPTSRFNDGKADKQGRLWIGTMGKDGTLTPNQGVFYKFTKDNLEAPNVMIAPVNISNGLTWNKANNKFYYIDSPTKKIVEYDYDDDKGDIKYSRVAFDVSSFPKLAGVPDGMTIDEDDNLWVALYGGGSIIKVNPKTGDLLKVVAIPARDVTSTMFGGPHLDILFVTTSRVSLSEEEKKQQPAAGALFAVTNLGAKGVPVFYADIVDSIKRKREEVVLYTPKRTKYGRIKVSKSRNNILAEIISSTTDLFAAPIGNEITSQNAKNLQKQRSSQNTPIWVTMLNTLRSIF